MIFINKRLNYIIVIVEKSGFIPIYFYPLISYSILSILI